ncbi:MAG: hypothetical protein MHMPM18_003349 [Marteilia pararefringens]
MPNKLYSREYLNHDKISLVSHIGSAKMLPFIVTTIFLISNAQQCHSRTCCGIELNPRMIHKIPIVSRRAICHTCSKYVRSNVMKYWASGAKEISSHQMAQRLFFSSLLNSFNSSNIQACTSDPVGTDLVFFCKKKKLKISIKNSLVPNYGHH